MDKFGVGDEFIHELSMAVDDFPVKSYLIKQCQSDLNKEVKISTTPGLAPGAQYSFKELLTDKVRDMVSTHNTGLASSNVDTIQLLTHINKPINGKSYGSNIYFS